MKGDQSKAEFDAVIVGAGFSGMFTSSSQIPGKSIRVR